MVDPIDIPDNLSKTRLPDKLKSVVRTNPERDRNGFSKALKEKMEEELEEKKKKRRDTVELQHQKSEEEHPDDKHEEATAEPEPEENELKDEDAPAKHVDLKA